MIIISFVYGKGELRNHCSYMMFDKLWITVLYSAVSLMLPISTVVSGVV